MLVFEFTLFKLQKYLFSFDQIRTKCDLSFQTVLDNHKVNAFICSSAISIKKKHGAMYL